MNREQAEHILDAYARMRMNEVDKDASDALREVILDVMTEYRQSEHARLPGITLATNSYPRNWDGTPKVTCSGIDPAFRINTAEVRPL